MTLLIMLIDRLDLSEVGLYNFEDYGDFWLSRLNCDYSYSFDESNGTLTIIADTQKLKKSLMTFGVEITGHNIESVVITNNDGSEAYPAQMKKLTDTRYLAIPDFTSSILGIEEIRDSNDRGLVSGLSGVYDLNGRLIRNLMEGERQLTDLPKGIYIIKEGTQAKKIII